VSVSFSHKVNQTQHMTSITAHRLHNQQIIGTGFKTPQALVAHMGAMQAQDYPMSRWAIGIRLPGSNDAQVEAALDAGELVRTHVLRPTWHLVSGQDARWMLALTEKHIRASFAARDRELGIDAKLYHQTIDLMVKALEGGQHLTRTEVMEALERGGIKTNSTLAVHFMFNAELAAVVCNGVTRGKEITYALMDEKVPPGLVLSREEALAELARRYFTSHAPATLQDFYWWSGLPMGDVRSALESIKAELRSLELEGKTYFLPLDSPDFVPQESVFFLPAFDEYCVSYKYREAVFKPIWHKEAITVNGIFKPIIVVNGQVVGTWKRTIKPKQVEIEALFFDKKDQLSTELVEREISAFGSFLGQPLVVKRVSAP
jgi:hypothetical protein